MKQEMIKQLESMNKQLDAIIFALDKKQIKSMSKDEKNLAVPSTNSS